MKQYRYLVKLEIEIVSDRELTEDETLMKVDEGVDAELDYTITDYGELSTLNDEEDIAYGKTNEIDGED